MSNRKLINNSLPNKMDFDKIICNKIVENRRNYKIMKNINFLINFTSFTQNIIKVMKNEKIFIFLYVFVCVYLHYCRV